MVFNSINKVSLNEKDSAPTRCNPEGLTLVIVRERGEIDYHYHDLIYPKNNITIYNSKKSGYTYKDMIKVNQTQYEAFCRYMVIYVGHEEDVNK